VHGNDRTDAINKMLRAIQDYQITGVETTLPFCAFVLKHEAFVSGKFDTGFIKNHFKPEYLDKSDANEEEVAAIFGAYMSAGLSAQTSKQINTSTTTSKWRMNRV